MEGGSVEACGRVCGCVEVGMDEGLITNIATIFCYPNFSLPCLTSRNISALFARKGKICMLNTIFNQNLKLGQRI